MQSRDHVVGAGAADRRQHGGLVVDARHVAEADRLPRAELEAEEVLERARQARPPLVGRHAGERRVVHENAPRRRLVHLREQLHERRLAGAVLADDGDHGAGRQRQRHIVEHQARRAGIGERHVIEADAAREHRGSREIGRRAHGARHNPRARPAVASRPSRSRAGIRSRRPWRRRTPTAASRPRAPAARRRPAQRARRHEDTAPT